MAAATWEQRTRTLNQAGYARYDESTSRMLGDTAEMLLDRYGATAPAARCRGRDPGRERTLLKECKGIGDVGADIFCREVQVAWSELFPFADRRALEAARRFGLEGDADSLARRVPEGLPAPARRSGAHLARQGLRRGAAGGEPLRA